MASLAPMHQVHFYESHDSLLHRLCVVACSDLRKGNSILIVYTKEHRTQLREKLERFDIDVRACVREGRFAVCDAAQLLSLFLVDGLPDAKLFMSSVGGLLANSRRAAKSKEKHVTVFGEMVAILWAQGNKAGALELEKLWTDAMNEEAFHLHCAYPRWFFGKNSSDMQDICEVHSHILGLATA
jgi:hypothetical protein